MTAVEDLIDGLQNARTSVFRLEGHQDYPDDELWQAYQRGELWDSDRDLADWCSLVSATVDRGVTWIRARVVVEPWTPYTRWEIEDHFPHNLQAGESIRLLDKNAGWDVPDFWMVDDTRAWFLTYGPLGDMAVTEASPRALTTLRSWRDAAVHAGRPLLAAAP